MKKSMLWAAMAAVAMTSCNNNEFDGVETEGNGLVKIEIGQKVEGIETKAAIAHGDRVEATIIATNGEAPADWTAFAPITENTFVDGAAWSATTFANVSVGSFEAGTNQTVGLNPTLYANPASGTSGGATLTGVAPKGTVENGKVVFSVLDGQQDVMTAETTERNPVVGGNMDAFALKFDHKTAQLRFRFAAVNNAGTAAWSDANIKIKSVTVKKTYVPTAVKLAKPLTVEWTKSALNLLFDNFTTNEVPKTYTDNSADFVTLDKQALVKPGVAVELDVMVTIDGEDKAYTAIKPLKGGAALTTEEGKYHNISLTIKQPASASGTPTITATATVTEWLEGDEGEAEL